MLTEARLITPQGKTIILSEDEYRKVAEILAVNEPSTRPSLSEVKALLAKLHGKYAGGRSLTQALLEERRQEYQREEAKVRRHTPHA